MTLTTTCVRRQVAVDNGQQSSTRLVSAAEGQTGVMLTDMQNTDLPPDCVTECQGRTGGGMDWIGGGGGLRNANEVSIGGMIEKPSETNRRLAP